MEIRNSRLYEILKDFLLIYVAKWTTPVRNIKLPKEIFEQEKLSKISYCTTCMGRTIHLKKTYLKNIKDNINYPHVEFILLNYNSGDDMDEWVNLTLKEYIEKGIVKYYKTTDPEEFHMSKAKNLSHRLATGEILVNLDADNFLGKNNAFYTNFIFNKKGPDILLRFTKAGFRYFDTCGRIALTKKNFEKLGGYREDLLPFGAEDLDLIGRSSHINLKIHNVEIVNFLKTIKHNNNLRKSNIKSEGSIKEMREHNSKMIKANPLKSSYKANENGFTEFNVYENNSSFSFRI